MSVSIKRFEAMCGEESGGPVSGILRAAPAVDEETAFMTTDPTVLARAVEEVTLVVYGWRQVEPGTLAWVFPSLTAAIAAAHAMRNAVRWAIVRGKREAAELDVDREREAGAVLVEQHG